MTRKMTEYGPIAKLCKAGRELGHTWFYLFPEKKEGDRAASYYTAAHEHKERLALEGYVVIPDSSLIKVVIE